MVFLETAEPEVETSRGAEAPSPSSPGRGPCVCGQCPHPPPRPGRKALHLRTHSSIAQPTPGGLPAALLQCPTPPAPPPASLLTAPLQKLSLQTTPSPSRMFSLRLLQALLELCSLPSELRAPDPAQRDRSALPLHLRTAPCPLGLGHPHLTSVPLPAWPARGWGKFDPTLPVSTGRTWGSMKGTGWPPDSGTRDPALRRGLGSPCRPGWRVPLAPPLPSLLSDHLLPTSPQPPQPSAPLCNLAFSHRPSPEFFPCPGPGLWPGPLLLLHRAGPHKSHSRVSRAQRRNQLGGQRLGTSRVLARAGACKHEWLRPGVGCSPPAAPPHSPSLHWPCSRLTIPPPWREGRAGSFPPGPLGSLGSKRAGPTRLASESRPDPFPLPGGLRALRRPLQSRAGRAPRPRCCCNLRLRQGSVSEVPTLTAQCPWPQHLPLLLHTCPRACVAACGG